MLSHVIFSHNCVHYDTMTRGVFHLFALLLVIVGGVEGFFPSPTRSIHRQNHHVAMTVSPSDTFALLFDCDGVIVETGTLMKFSRDAFPRKHRNHFHSLTFFLLFVCLVHIQRNCIDLRTTKLSKPLN